MKFAGMEAGALDERQLITHQQANQKPAVQ